MAGRRILLPTRNPVLDADGLPVSGALIYFYTPGTNTPKTVYQDQALTTPHAHPIVADATGEYPSIWADEAEAFDFAIRDGAGAPVFGLRDLSNLTPSVAIGDGLLTATAYSQTLLTQTSAAAWRIALATNDAANVSLTASNAVIRAVSAILSDAINVRNYGALGDAQLASGAVMVTGAPNTLTCANATFVAGDVGKVIVVQGAGAAGANLVTTIAARVSATVVTTTDACSTNVGSSFIRWGTNDAVAIQAAITYAAPLKRAIYFPGGDYISAATLSYSTSGDTGLAMMGDGRNLSRVFFTGGTDGFSYTSTSTSSARGELNVRDLGIYATAPLTGSGLKGVWATGGNLQPTLSVFDCTIFSEMGGYFTKIVSGDNAQNTTISNPQFLGEVSGSVKTTHGVHLTGNSTIARVMGGAIIEAGTGVLAEGDTEGVYVIGTEILQVQYGVTHDVDGGSDANDPLLHVIGCHINASYGGVTGLGSMQSLVSGTHFYAGADAGIGSDWYGVKWDGGSRDCSVVSCYFENLPGAAAGTKAIILADGARHTVNDCRIYGGATAMDVGVEVGSGVTGSRIDFLCNSQVTTPVSDASGGVNNYRYNETEYTRTSIVRARSESAGFVVGEDENLSDANNTTKTVARVTYGRDTGGTRKETARRTIVPGNSNLTSSVVADQFRDGNQMWNGWQLSPAADTETVGILLVNLGGVYYEKRVSVGAADSGGAGYRLLRIAN